MVYGNSTTEANYEEMNLWYSWVHIRDVLTMRAAHAVQRFELSKYQPKNAVLNRKVLACYEIPDIEYCNAAHLKRLGHWQMMISNSFATGEGNYNEAHWTTVASTADWADYADYAGERGVFTVKMKAKGAVSPADYFTKEKLTALSKLPGFTACHLMEYHAELQMVQPATPPDEPLNFNLVCQISNAYAVAKEWDAFLEANPDVADCFEMAPAIYVPIMNRIRDIDLFKCPEWRAIQALAHLTLNDVEGRRAPLLEDVGVDRSTIVDKKWMEYPDPVLIDSVDKW